MSDYPIHLERFLSLGFDPHDYADRQLRIAKKVLDEGDCTCVLRKYDEVVTSNMRGVKPLVQLVESGTDYRGFFAADKVVGKATAFLYIRLRVYGVYAKVISKAALETLRKQNIYVDYEKLVEHISNRQGDGICPFEEAVLQCDEPEEAYTLILDKMKQMNISI